MVQNKPSTAKKKTIGSIHFCKSYSVYCLLNNALTLTSTTKNPR